ncbi:hypothetical protein [Laspinema olomoucense]|uniref:hypothetical protein n=1 Tax=Laspinema olomoucense TaxID=3231600 RepID=UPI0021BAD0DF|nr:hypothetical protein [Laspinema sp. D3d]MCT7972837.1 hypothetical protein [Laspinema sp. D3d]
MQKDDYEYFRIGGVSIQIQPEVANFDDIISSSEPDFSVQFQKKTIARLLPRSDRHFSAN